MFHIDTHPHTPMDWEIKAAVMSFLIWNWIGLFYQWEHFLLIIPFIVFECLVLVNSLCLKQLQTLSWGKVKNLNLKPVCSERELKNEISETLTWIYYKRFIFHLNDANSLEHLRPTGLVNLSYSRVVLSLSHAKVSAITQTLSDPLWLVLVIYLIEVTKYTVCIVFKCNC